MTTSLHTEVWKPVALTGWGDFYEVSNFGRVRNRRNGYILEPKPSGKRGYIGITLKANGKKKCTYVHILVCRTFKGKPPSKKHEVCHRDGDGSHNNSSNLYWGTRKDNFQDMIRHRRTFPRMFSDKQARAIKARLPKETSSAIARTYGVSPNTIENIRKGRTYADV